MNTVLNAAWTADQVLKAYPKTAKVFVSLKTDCVGCHLARFCSLEEVAASYHLPLDDLLHKLRDAAQISDQ